MKKLSILKRVITLRRVLKWLLATEPNIIIRIGTKKGSGWLYANYTVSDFCNDIIPIEHEKLLIREVVEMYESEGRSASKDCEALKPALCIVIEGRENGLW